MRIIFLGTGEFGVPALRALREAGHEILAVLSQPDRPAGRGREVRPTPIHAAAVELGLPHVQVEDVNAAEHRPLFEAAEMGVVVAFGQKIGPAILGGAALPNRALPNRARQEAAATNDAALPNRARQEAAATSDAALPNRARQEAAATNDPSFSHGALLRGCINIHASLLPKYRGAAPIQRAILSGDAETGVTVFQLDERWDAGAIWAARSTPIGETETADELHDRLARIGAELIVETVAGIAAGTLQPRPQDASQATRAAKLSKSEGTVDWSQPAGVVVRRIHGLWSWPGAACLFVSRRGRQERVLLVRAAVADAETPPDSEFAPGSFRTDRTVQTGRGTVRLLEVQPASGKRMDFAAFANGRQIAPPDRLERMEL